MTFDFSQEEEQREQGPQGPVPAGSIVVLRMEVLEPSADRQASEDRFISVAASGLRQLYCKFAVTEGRYAGVWWKQSVTLPCAMQKISLQPKQETACRIGGATLKAILESANKNPRIQSLNVFTGLTFPCKVKLNNKPYVADNGAEYWRNEIATVITPAMKVYAQAKREREIIAENGPVSGNSSQGKSAASSGHAQTAGSEEQEYDSVPF